MSIYVIRHADKEVGEFYRSDLPLNDQPISEAGREESRKLVPFFMGIDIASIHVSEYIRTGQTIQWVAKDKGLQAIKDSRLNEINVGDTKLFSDSQIEEMYPEFWKAYKTRDHDFRFPNGESGDEAGDRIFDLFTSLDTDRHHILVSHDGVIRTLLCKVLGLPTYKRHLFTIDLCSITVFEFSREFNCWATKKINS